ncbi:MAG: CapA family protein [Muribaculaceae bacterium]|jgi:poly-gamma-glutamate synthesis protein (capsule biosynthesis protein)|nr:CapA family protein [Muribaculaceae bacterium]
MSAAWLIPLFTSLASLVFGNSEADLVFVGDAMQHQAQLDAARKGKDYDYTGYFDDIKPFVSVADYAVVNLETPVSTPPYSGYPCFNAPPAFLDALADAGFDLFLTANNHTLDRGARGLRKTIEELDVRRLAHTGTFANDSARAESVPMIVNVNDFKIGFLNYTYGTNGISPRDGVVVDYIDRPAIRRDVENSRKAGAELICVCVHWGDEYKLLPNASQRYLADFLEAIGVDMIIGGHPHVIQPMELRPNKYYPDKNILLVYSLGNFVSNMKTADTRGGALAHVKLFRGDDKKPMVQSAVYRLLFTIPGTPGSSNYRVMEADSVKDSAWRARAAEFSRRARQIFDKHNIAVPELKR